MKSFIVASGIFLLVIGLLTWNSLFILRCTDALTASVMQLPQNTYGDPVEYETAMQNIHIIWKKKREIIAVTVPRRITEPLERSMRALEAGWIAEDDAMYRQSIADLLNALENLREAEGFSLDAIV